MSHTFRVRITRAGIYDAEEFLRLEAKCFRMRFYSNVLYYWRPIIDYGWAFKAVERRRIVGGVMAILTRDQQIYINSLFVDPKVRRRGVGTRLLSRVLSLRPRRGFILDVKAEERHLLKFYGSHGFEEVVVDRNYYLDGTTRVIMMRMRREPRLTRIR